MDGTQTPPLTEHLGRWHPVGPHEVRVDDDIVWIRNHGVVTGANQQQLHTLCVAVYERFGYILVLNDASEMTSMSPEARRVLSDRMRERIYPSHTAIYGAKSWMHAMAVLTQRAIQLLTRKTFPVTFSESESAARAVLTEQRLRLAAAKR